MHSETNAQDLNTTLLHDCLSHAMLAARTLVLKHYIKRQHKTVVMFWVSVVFSCITFVEFKRTWRVYQCYYFTTLSSLVNKHYRKFKKIVFLTTIFTKTKHFAKN